MPTFLDTHVWVWWVTEDRRLSNRAGSVIRHDLAREGIWISAISIWEVAKKVEKRKLSLDRPLRQWIELATSADGLYVAELTNAILVESCDLPPPFHGDPADQMIVASVRHHSGRLVTKDAALHRYPHVLCLW
jgi:PIN domain nuclease of toxin-antitoxin system